MSSTYLLQDNRLNVVQSPGFTQICELAVDAGLSYVVLATASIRRMDSDDGYIRFAVVLSVYGAWPEPHLCALDEDQFDLDSTRGHVADSGAPAHYGTFGPMVITRHISLMVAATIPESGGAGGYAPGGAPIDVYPARVLLDARAGEPGHGRASLTDIRITAIPADQVFVKTIQDELPPIPSRSE